MLCESLSQIISKYEGISFAPINGQIRCLAHTVNLIVQSILHNLGEADDPEDSDYYDKSVPFHYDIADDEELCELEAEGRSSGNQMSTDDDEDEENADLDFSKMLQDDEKKLRPLDKVSHSSFC